MGKQLLVFLDDGNLGNVFIGNKRKLRMVEKANGYKEKRTNEALGDAKAFLSVLEEYRKAKEITRLRLYLETMSKVLPRCGKITLIDEDQEGVLPLLPLGEKEGGVR